MSTEEQAILYDIPSLEGTCWSLNPWKTRMVLNYKSVPYKTQWIEYPDLAETLAGLGIPPNSPSTNPVPYSSPSILYPSPNPTFEMDSWAIAHTLDSLFPSPPLHLSHPTIPLIRDLTLSLSNALRPFTIPRVPALLPARSAAYFLDTRKERFGKSLEQVLAEDADEECWVKAAVPARQIVELLWREEGGPFFLGKEVSYADFVFVSFLHFVRRVDREGDVFERVLGLDDKGGFERLYEACKVWLERDT